MTCTVKGLLIVTNPHRTLQFPSALPNISASFQIIVLVLWSRTNLCLDSVQPLWSTDSCFPWNSTDKATLRNLLAGQRNNPAYCVWGMRQLFTVSLVYVWMGIFVLSLDWSDRFARDVLLLSDCESTQSTWSLLTDTTSKIVSPENRMSHSEVHSLCPSPQHNELDWN